MGSDRNYSRDYVHGDGLVYLGQICNALLHKETRHLRAIPFHEMCRIINDYGPEPLLLNRDEPKKIRIWNISTVTKQFRRWNPLFFLYFEYSAEAEHYVLIEGRKGLRVEDYRRIRCLIVAAKCVI